MRGWQIDRAARRPSGPAGRAQYREPVYHRPNFAEILQRLELGPHDRLLEVGCGGGAFLHEALKSGCRASAVDHSPDLLEVAGQQNERAVTSGHLRLEYADAAALPFPDAQFTCAVMTGVLGWLPRPEAVLREIWRTLRPGGRMIVYDGTPRMYGTPAAGPRILGGVRLYEDRELSALAKSAGFSRVRVDHPDLTGHAKASGIPGEALYLFEPEFNHILQAERPTDRSARAPRKSPGRPSRKGPGRGRSLTARSLAR
jgi:SAM-dependent methyltransferase